jgi:hypothetical protein
MKKKSIDEMDDDLRPEYDLHQLLKTGIRGKYVKQYQAGTNLVLLAPDVAKVFANNAEAVNEALRLVIQMARLPVGKKRRPARSLESSPVVTQRTLRE